MPREYSIIVIKGDVFGQRFDMMNMDPVISEMPRLMVDEVEHQVIGEPVAYYKAVHKNKYVDIQTKYPEDYFKIPYTQHFIDRYIHKLHPLTSIKEQAYQLVD